MTATRPELPVPVEAQRAYDRATIELMMTVKTGVPGSVGAADHVRAIASPVVAAVLRAEADRLERAAHDAPWGDAGHNAVRADALVEVARGLRARAGKL